MYSFGSKRQRVIVGALLVVSLALQSCGESRSVASFCETLQGETERLAEKYNTRFGSLDSAADPVGALLGLGVGLVEALGDAVVLYDKVEKVAPPEIASDVARIRDVLRSQVDDAGRGSLLGGLVAGISTAGSFDRVDAYINAHCR